MIKLLLVCLYIFDRCVGTPNTHTVENRVNTSMDDYRQSMSDPLVALHAEAACLLGRLGGRTGSSILGYRQTSNN